MSKPLPTECPPVRNRLNGEFTSSLLCLTCTDRLYGLVTSNLAQPERNVIAERHCFGRSTNLVRPQRNLTGERRCFGRSKLVRACTYFSDAFHLARRTMPCRLSTYFPGAPERNFTKTDIRRFEQVTGKRRFFGQPANLACLVVVGVAHSEKLEAENKTQECKIFYIFISSVQLKSLGQTNLLVRRREFTSCLLCLTNSLYRLLTSNSRLTFKLDSNLERIWTIAALDG